jgi:hypothetical protein
MAVWRNHANHHHHLIGCQSNFYQRWYCSSIWSVRRPGMDRSYCLRLRLQVPVLQRMVLSVCSCLGLLSLVLKRVNCPNSLGIYFQYVRCCHAKARGTERDSINMKLPMNFYMTALACTACTATSNLSIGLWGVLIKEFPNPSHSSTSRALK